MALAERLLDDMSMLLKNTRSLGKQTKKTSQSHAKRAAVNDGRYNDDEDAENKTENYGCVLGITMKNGVKTSSMFFSPLKQLL